jgi:ABC-type phosphate/phosphonate transport system permease subunit
MFTKYFAKPFHTKVGKKMVSTMRTISDLIWALIFVISVGLFAVKVDQQVKSFNLIGNI